MSYWGQKLEKLKDVKALDRWATGKRLTNRLPKLSLITKRPFPSIFRVPGDKIRIFIRHTLARTEVAVIIGERVTAEYIYLVCIYIMSDTQQVTNTS